MTSGAVPEAISLDALVPQKMARKAESVVAEAAFGALPHRKLVIGLALFSAISAIGGSAELIFWQHGNPYLPIELIRNTPFETFLIPGLILAGVVGGASLACSVLAWRRSRAAIDAPIIAGGALTGWISPKAPCFVR